LRCSGVSYEITRRRCATLASDGSSQPALIVLTPRRRSAQPFERLTVSDQAFVARHYIGAGVAVPIGQASARVSSRFGPRASPLSARRHAAISMPLHVPLSCSPWPCPTSASSRAHDQLMCSLTYLLTHLLTYSLTHLLTYSRAHEQLMCYKHCRPCYTVLAVLMSSSHVLQTLPPLLHCTRSGFDAPRGDREGAGARRA